MKDKFNINPEKIEEMKTSIDINESKDHLKDTYNFHNQIREMTQEDLNEIMNSPKHELFDEIIEETKPEEKVVDEIITCPCCKSNNVEYKEIRDSNGIMGPGYSSWIVSSYYVCRNCGVMFQKVN